MTRINLVPVEELYDQHLIAEYREMPMVGKALQRSLRTKSKIDVERSIPKNFTLNKGHVKFFYNKSLYLQERYNQIVSEMKSRGFNPDPNRLFNLEDFTLEFDEIWTPNEIVRERITQRLNERKGWYRKTPHLTKTNG